MFALVFNMYLACISPIMNAYITTDGTYSIVCPRGAMTRVVPRVLSTTSIVKLVCTITRTIPRFHVPHQWNNASYYIVISSYTTWNNRIKWWRLSSEALSIHIPQFEAWISHSALLKRGLCVTVLHESLVLPSIALLLLGQSVYYFNTDNLSWIIKYV